MLIKFALTAASVYPMLALVLSGLNPMVKIYKPRATTSFQNVQPHTVSRSSSNPSHDIFCKHQVQPSEESFQIEPIESRGYIRRRKLIHSNEMSLDLPPKCETGNFFKRINNIRRSLTNGYSLKNWRRDDLSRLSFISKNPLKKNRVSDAHKSNQNHTDKLERRNPAILLNPLLLPLRLLLALFRILTLPLRVLLAPVFLLLRAIVRFLFLLVQLLNPFFYLVLFVQGGQLVFNIARMILMIIRMILRRIFRRREDKDEHEEIEVITLVQEDRKPVKKYHKEHIHAMRRSIEDSSLAPAYSLSFERVGKQLRLLVESLKQHGVLVDSRSCSTFQLYIGKGEDCKQINGHETSTDILAGDTGLEKPNQGIPISSSNSSGQNRCSILSLVKICEITNSNMIGNEYSYHRPNIKPLPHIGC